VAGKQAEAQRIMGEINSLDSRVEQAVERYNLANVKLERIGRDLSRTRYELGVARANLKRAQTALAKQAAEIYTSRDSNSTIEVLLGASSLDDLLNRLDTVSRVSDQRSSLLGDVTKFRAQIGRQAAELQRAQSEQRQIVAQRAAAKHAIESKIAQQQSLYNSIKGQIASLIAAEQRRQLQAAEAARARIEQAHRAQQLEASATVVGISAISPSSETIVAPPSSFSGAVGVAMAQLGKPYVWAAAGPDAFDCSGLVVYSFGAVGKSLPHSTYALYSIGVPVSRDQLQPGDLVFFDGLGHVGIYIGGDQFVHAPHTGDVVKVSSLDEGWYASSYVGARRIL
jgi:cell wall-associated NlpC family hydrolase